MNPYEVLGVKPGASQEEIKSGSRPCGSYTQTA